MKYSFLLKIVIVLCVVTAGIMFVIARKQASAVIEYEPSAAVEDQSLFGESTPSESSGSSKDTLLIVYVCGAVKNPGVYELPVGSRIWDCVLAAGGFSEEASETSLNLAALVSDGDKILVPTVSEAEAQSEAARIASDGRVNINTAGVEELMTLPGIGQARAEAIIAYRTSHGNFEKPEDIMNISGIKDAAYEKIKDKIKTIDSG